MEEANNHRYLMISINSAYGLHRACSRFPYSQAAFLAVAVDPGSNLAVLFRDTRAESV